MINVIIRRNVMIEDWISVLVRDRKERLDEWRNTL